MSSTGKRIVCTLSDTSRADQASEWQDLQRQATAVAPVPGGARMRFPARLEPQVADLARRERTCCAFLTLELGADEGDVVLDVTSEHPDALAVISLLAGIPLE